MACGFGLVFKKEHKWSCSHPRLKDWGGCTALGRRERAFSRWVQSSTSNFSVILPVTLLKGGTRWHSVEGAVLQIGRSLVRSQMVSLEFFIDIILPIALWR